MRIRSVARALRPAPSSSPRLFAQPPLRLASTHIPSCHFRVQEKKRLEVQRKNLLELAASKPKIKAVLIDGAGSSGDPKGKGTKIAMMDATIKSFKESGIQIINPLEPIEAHNGQGKIPHFKAILLWLEKNDPNVKKQGYHDNPRLLERDAIAIYEKLKKEGIGTIEMYSTPVEGFQDFAAQLKAKEITLVLQTAYGDTEANAFEKTMRKNHVEFAHRITSSNVIHPRDFPAMLHQGLDKLGLKPWQVAIPGDTPADMKAAEGFWSVGLPDYSAFLPMRDMSPAELHKERQRVADLLVASGAQYVLLDRDWRKPESLADKMFAAIADMEARMAQGYFPHVSITDVKEKIANFRVQDIVEEKLDRLTML